MSDEKIHDKPPGFEKIQRTVRGETIDSPSCSIELFLPQHLVDHFNDEKRIGEEAKRKVARESRERLAARLEAAQHAAEEKAAPPSILATPRIPAKLASPQSFSLDFDFDPQFNHLVYAATEPEAVVLRTKLTSDEEVKRRDLEIVDRLRAKGPLREIINPFLSDPSLAPFDKLAGLHPHFGEVIDFVKIQVVRCKTNAKPLRIPPVLLHGGPGLGKSHFTRDLSVALGTVCRLCSWDGAASNTTLLGSDRKWGNSAIGVLFDLVCLGDCANPVLLLDELDKVGRDTRDDPLAPLHSLLEPSTAMQVRDASLDFVFDASLVTWIATANHVMFIPSSLRSRFREFHIVHPTAEEAITLAFSVAADVIEKTASPDFAKPKREVVLRLAHLTPREIYQVVEEAVGRAALNQRTRLEVSDLPAELIQLDGDSHLEGNGGVRYLH